jgi:hypothetical protein
MDPTSGNVRVTRHRLRTGRTRSVLLSAQSPMLQLVRGRLFISSSTGLFEIT